MNDDPQLFATDDTPPPLPFAWHTLDEHTQAHHALELAAWVDWLTTRYELHDRIPPCWQQHGPLVEELTALWCAWGAAYHEPSFGDSATRWHGDLSMFFHRHDLYWKRTSIGGCRHDRHNDPAPTKPNRRSHGSQPTEAQVQ
jgi:hypothetical protein